MEALIHYFLENLDRGLWTGFLALGIYLLLKKEPSRLVKYYTDRRDKRHDFARLLLTDGKLTEEANIFLRESLEKSAFFRYYGINADAHMRSGLINLHSQHQGTISWTHIRRAHPHLRLMENHVGVQLHWYDHALRWLVTMLSFLTAIYSLLAITVTVANSKQLAMSQFFGMTFFSLLLFGGSMVFASLNWPYHAARRIDLAVRSGNR